MRLMTLIIGAAAMLAAGVAQAQDYAAQLREGDAVLRDFRFGSGERLPELRMHYATLGTPRRDRSGRIANAVMILHGTGGTGRQFLQHQFAGELFGPGQPLDALRYFIILPDNIGHGRSSKPSDGMRMRFPQYDYDDMVEAQRRTLERLGVRRLRLLMGTSMGCMHGFVWAQAHPDFADAMMPLACLPTEIAGHNRMWRKAAVEGIRSDPAWAGGEYRSQPVQGLRTAVSLLQVAGMAPLYVSRDDVPAEVLEEQKRLFAVDAERDGRPAARIATIVEGKLNKWLEAVCLLEQPYRDTDRKIGELITEKVALLGENIRVARFVRMGVGETSGADAEAA